MQFTQNIDKIKSLFVKTAQREEKYRLLIELGRKLPPLHTNFKIPDNLIDNCQSTTYIHTFLEEGLVNIEASSDALISAGLAALLILAYNRQPPDIILKFPPKFFEDIKIDETLSVNRTNGFFYMYLRLKKDALKFLKKGMQTKNYPL